MLTYLDSSVLGRAYLADEPGHVEAGALLEDPETVLVTATLTRVEVTGLLVRAARAGRCEGAPLVAALHHDLGPDGAVTTLVWPQHEVERVASDIVTEHGIRARTPCTSRSPISPDGRWPTGRRCGSPPATPIRRPWPRRTTSPCAERCNGHE